MSVSGCNCKGLLLLDYYVRQPVYNVVPKRNVFSHSTTCSTEFAWKKETGQGRTALALKEADHAPAPPRATHG